MLFYFTALMDFLGMSISLWLGTYLLARALFSRTALRAVVVLLAVAAFFLSAYLNLYGLTPNTASWRAALLIVGFVAWYDLAYRLLPATTWSKARWLTRGVYALGLAALGFLFGIDHIFVESGNDPLWVTPVRVGLGYIGYGTCVVAITTATLYSLHLGAQAGAGLYNRYFVAATLIAAGMSVIGYSAAALTTLGVPPTPRLAQDGLLLGAVVLLGYSVARHQALIERRTTLQDFPVTALALVGIVSLYILLAWQMGLPPIALVFLTILTILTHSAYDVLRDVLDRLLYRQRSALRRQLRRLAREVEDEQSLSARLQQGLASLCHTLDAEGGFIASRQGEPLVVRATVHSIPKGSSLEIPTIVSDDVSPPPPALAEHAAWIAPAIVGNEVVAVIGLGPRGNQSQYSEADLDLLAEMADWVGRLASAQIEQQKRREQVARLVAEADSPASIPVTRPEDLIAAFESELDQQFTRQVEEGLRHLSDYTTLGQSDLATQLGIEGVTHVERGKAIREALIQAIAALRPTGPRPPEPLPREWQGYATLHDAYIEDAPNREIMARLYISEGTFNRQRRKALRAVAHALLEIKHRHSVLLKTAAPQEHSRS